MWMESTTKTKVSRSDTLVFKLMGYQMMLARADKSTINVELSKILFSLDDVVFKKKRSNINDTELRRRTGSVVEISALELQNSTNSNLMHILQGKVAGLKIEKSGELGTEPKIRIRGNFLAEKRK